MYTLTSVGKEDLTLSISQQRKLAKMSESLKKSWQQIKQMEAGILPSQSAMDFIDEL